MEQEVAVQDPEQRDSKTPVIGLVALVVVVVLLILLLVPGLITSGLEGAPREIVAVPESEPLPGSVSVWISAEVGIDQVLADVDHSEIVGLGEGRYVVDVPIGTEESVAERLAEREGVYDAGLVYEDPADPSP